jgi:DICT domain-containing protein
MKITLDHPLIEQAKALAQTHNKEIVIILHIKGEELGYASYGKNKVYCRAARRLADVAYKAVRDYILGITGEPL